MNRRRLLAAFTLGLTLFAAPALAKDKQVLKAGAPKTVSGVVDMDPAHDPDNVLYLDLSNGGRVAIRLIPTWAPTHIERIKTLARQGFYNGAIFHRVIDGFMAQTGDPTGTGQGGSSLPDLKAEFNAMPHLRGSVSMARTENPDSANSQFFIVFYPRFALDRKYTNFGGSSPGCSTPTRSSGASRRPIPPRSSRHLWRRTTSRRCCLHRLHRHQA